MGCIRLQRIAEYFYHPLKAALQVKLIHYFHMQNIFILIFFQLFDRLNKRMKTLMLERQQRFVLPKYMQYLQKPLNYKDLSTS